MTKLPVPYKAETIDVRLRDKMDAIDALIEAIASAKPDCDLMLAELLNNESEELRKSIIEKIREMLRAKAQEKEKELDKIIDRQRREEVTRQRNVFRQWLTWMMSEENLRKIREAFMAAPMLEQLVRGIGHTLANKGVQNQMNPAQKQDLGALSANIAQSQAAQREKEKRDQGRGG